MRLEINPRIFTNKPQYEKKPQISQMTRIRFNHHMGRDWKLEIERMISQYSILQPTISIP
jgi:hypothetical protein